MIPKVQILHALHTIDKFSSELLTTIELLSFCNFLQENQINLEILKE